MFGEKNKLEAIAMPSPEVLTDEYFTRMYPAEQKEEDTAKGLIAFRPSWWNIAAADKFISNKRRRSMRKSAELPMSQLYVASMKAEAEKYQGTVFLTESLPKPNYTSGTEAYGSKEGSNPNLDPLLPLIQEVFGRTQKNRFSLIWDDVNTIFIPRVKQAIIQKCRNKGLTITPFEVVCTPALVANKLMSEHHPELSSTSTAEWTSTPLLREDGTDSDYRLIVGYADRGGAAYVSYYGRGDACDGGFRLSVVSA